MPRDLRGHLLNLQGTYHLQTKRLDLGTTCCSSASSGVALATLSSMTSRDSPRTPVTILQLKFYHRIRLPVYDCTKLQKSMAMCCTYYIKIQLIFLIAVPSSGKQKGSHVHVVGSSFDKRLYLRHRATLLRIKYTRLYH